MLEWFACLRRSGRSLCRIAPLVAASLAFALVFAGVAMAATVRRDAQDDVVQFLAEPGETNRVTAHRVGRHTIVVSDARAVLHGEGSCTAVDAHVALCSAPGRAPYQQLQVTAGDMDDRVRSEVPLVADGGPGDDTLVAPTRDSREALLNGGGGRDTLRGGRGADTLTDGDKSGEADADIIDGGGFIDTVSYQSRTAPVYVDLGDRGTGGEVGEGDVLTAVESVVGGAAGDDLRAPDVELGYSELVGGGGPDRLIGRAAGDRLSGGPGRDRLTGHAGQDKLSGGAGRDRLDGGRELDSVIPGAGRDRVAGGPGDDYFYLQDAARDRIRCGSGVDTVVSSDVRDLLPAGCEQGALYDERFAPPVVDPDVISDLAQVIFAVHPDRVGARRVVFRVGCADNVWNDESDPVAGTITLREDFGRRRLLGRGDLTTPARRCRSLGQRVRVPVRLTARGRALTSRPGGARVSVKISEDRITHDTAEWALHLKPPD